MNRLPDTFLWGGATAANQIEGGYREKYPDNAAEAFMAESILSYQEAIAKKAKEIHTCGGNKR